MNKCVKISFLIIGMFILLIEPLISQTEVYKFRHLTTDNGLPTNTTSSLIKDSRGFVWIGTKAGLCRYDGYDIKIYQYDPFDTNSLTDNNIMDKDLIAEDHEGNIWVGTQNGLNKLNPVTNNTTRYKHLEETTNSL